MPSIYYSFWEIVNIVFEESTLFGFWSKIICYSLSILIVIAVFTELLMWYFILEMFYGVVFRTCQVEHILLKNLIIHGSIKCSKSLTISWSINNASFLHISSKPNITMFFVCEIKANFILNLFWVAQFSLDQITVGLGQSNYLFWSFNFWAKFFTLVSHITVSVEVVSLALLLWWNIAIPGVVVYLCV